jgi:hypothetical protein
MNDTTSTLERRLERALHERAEAMPAPIERLPLPVVELRRSRRPMVWAAAAALVVLAAAAATAVATKPFASDSRPATPTPSTLPTPTTLPSPPAAAGAEVPLARADTEDTRMLITTEQRRNPGSSPVAVVSPGRAPIVVTGPCMTIAAAVLDGIGYQGSCVPNPATTFVGSVDTGAIVTAESRVYGAWVDLPADTAYVLYTYGDERWWQRPLDGITYLTTDARPKLGGEPLVARAFDAANRQLAEIRQTPIRDGAGDWDWY